jgi:hypothetical protein
MLLTRSTHAAQLSGSTFILVRVEGGRWQERTRSETHTREEDASHVLTPNQLRL